MTSRVIFATVLLGLLSFALAAEMEARPQDEHKQAVMKGVENHQLDKVEFLKKSEFLRHQKTLLKNNPISTAIEDKTNGTKLNGTVVEEDVDAGAISSTRNITSYAEIKDGDTIPWSSFRSDSFSRGTNYNRTATWYKLPAQTNSACVYVDSIKVDSSKSSESQVCVEYKRSDGVAGTTALKKCGKYNVCYCTALQNATYNVHLTCLGSSGTQSSCFHGDNKHVYFSVKAAEVATGDFKSTCVGETLSTKSPAARSTWSVVVAVFAMLPLLFF